MKKHNGNLFEDQQRRLDIKDKGSQMKKEAMEGTGMSPWEADVLVGIVDKVYFAENNKDYLQEGQMKYLCTSAEDGAGKPLANCKLVSVVLTIHDNTDYQDLPLDSCKQRSMEIRRRKLLRIADEAKEQGGFLTQEDLAKLLHCDVRTVRRDIKDLKNIGVILPTRGQQKDIGPGVSHRSLAIRQWIEGKETVAIANHIKHSIEAVENYLQKFKRVAYLKEKKFSTFDIALTIGISNYAASTYSEIYDEFRNQAFFESRMAEINLVGGQYYASQDEKKRSVSLKAPTNNDWRAL